MLMLLSFFSFCRDDKGINKSDKIRIFVGELRSELALFIGYFERCGLFPGDSSIHFASEMKHNSRAFRPSLHSILQINYY